MGRGSERLSRPRRLSGDAAGEGDVIQVVSRAFDLLRCFEGHEARLGNLETSNRCVLPRSIISRLTDMLMRMGQVVYLRRDQKYRMGPSALAMSTSKMKASKLRNLLRQQVQDGTEQLPGTARSANALDLHEVTGSRISMASTAARHGYTAALDPLVCDAQLAEMQREVPESVRLLRPLIENSRRLLGENGFVVACGLRSPHINALAVALWSPQYQSFVAVTIGLLAPVYDKRRRHEVAPTMLEPGAAVGGLLESAEGDLLNNRLEPKQLGAPAQKNHQGGGEE